MFLREGEAHCGSSPEKYFREKYFFGQRLREYRPRKFFAGRIIAVGKTFRGHAQENKKC